MTNDEYIAEAVNRDCFGGHDHIQLLHSQQATLSLTAHQSTCFHNFVCNRVRRRELHTNFSTRNLPWWGSSTALLGPRTGTSSSAEVELMNSTPSFPVDSKLPNMAPPRFEDEILQETVHALFLFGTGTGKRTETATHVSSRSDDEIPKTFTSPSPFSEQGLLVKTWRGLAVNFSKTLPSSSSFSKQHLTDATSPKPLPCQSFARVCCHSKNMLHAIAKGLRNHYELGKQYAERAKRKR